jgi:hypothetical protein
MSGHIVDAEADPVILGHSPRTSISDRETLQNSVVRIYPAMPPQGYISGVPPEETITVGIGVESVSELENTSSGIVGWAFCVKVDPNVLEPVTVNDVPERSPNFSTDGFLLDFIWKYEYSGHPVLGVLYVVDKTEGEFKEIAEFIGGWGALGVGAGGDGELCELRFKSKSQTAYTIIDVYEACYWTADGRIKLFDVVDDGHYNEP